jgi:hypothetical protein
VTWRATDAARKLATLPEDLRGGEGGANVWGSGADATRFSSDRYLPRQVYCDKCKPMARPKKLPRGAKSQAVRDYLKAHRRAMPAQVVAVLEAKGVNVLSQMVGTLRAKMGRRRRAACHNGFDLDCLLAAKARAEKVGGFERAREAVNALARLA